MSKFISIYNPNLPAGKVKHVVVSGEYPQFIDELESCGITAVTTEACTDIMPSVQHHADMLFSYLGNGEYLIEKSQLKLKEELDKLKGFTCKDTVSLNAKYPNDILLNSCIIGDIAICCKKNVHPAYREKFKIVEVSQGYSKCSVCVVDENSIITDDESVYSGCKNTDIDVLLVRKGSVLLNGFNYGFIGGCCGKISYDYIAFCGDIDTHCDASKIKSFLKFRNINYISLGKSELTDIGSILPITQSKK